MSLAEACFSVPAVRAMRAMRPQSTLVVLCPESLAPIWNRVTELNGVISYPDKSNARNIAALLKAQDIQFESAICWEAGEAAKAFARLQTVQRLGYPAKGLDKILTDVVSRVVSPGPIEHRVKHYLTMVQELGGDPFVKQNFQTPPLPPAPQPMRIALAPASGFGASYRWPLEKYAELVQSVDDLSANVEWVILGQGRDKETQSLCAKLADLLEGRATNHAAEWGMEETLHALPHCSALVAGDGDTAHLAAHVGLPAVVIFGPGEPAWKRPLGKQSRVVREHVACSPCFDAKCALDHRCMTTVEVGDVFKQLELAVAERATG
ncbi:MAG: glycosyltransferase family 9 protein [Akkermansiaceae bacterium]